MAELRIPPESVGERARIVLEQYLAPSLAGPIASKIAYEYEALIQKHTEAETATEREPTRGGKASCRSAPTNAETQETARAKAKGYDPLTRKEMQRVLSQGGYLKREHSCGQYGMHGLYEGGGGGLICFITSGMVDRLVIDGDIQPDIRHTGTANKATTWVGA